MDPLLIFVGMAVWALAYHVDRRGYDIAVQLEELNKKKRKR